MADVSIKYKGAEIASLSASGTKTLTTSGKYCEGDISVVYTDPEKPTQTKTVSPSTSQQTVTPDSGKVLSSVTVEAVTASIDSNIQASNILDGVSILGVDGSVAVTHVEVVNSQPSAQSGKDGYIFVMLGG